MMLLMEMVNVLQLSERIIREQNLDSVDPLRLELEAALRSLRNQANAGIDLPRVCYDIGGLELLLGRPYASLNALARAALLTDLPDALEERIDLSERMHRALGTDDADWVWRFLQLAATAKRRDVSESTDEAAISGRLARLANDSETLSIYTEPIVIVAGGSDVASEETMHSYAAPMQDAFARFEGTVFSGGTMAGVSRLVGDLDGAFRKVTYPACNPPCGSSWHDGYIKLPCVGEGFSPMQPLQNWTDLVVAGCDIARVKLLGIGGGRISAFEYRLALVMGATVGLLQGSGREARAFLDDPTWGEHERVVALPADGPALADFLKG